MPRGDVATEVAKLRGQPGGDLLVEGSAQLVQTLAQSGLVDEYRLRASRSSSALHPFFLCYIMLSPSTLLADVLHVETRDRRLATLSEALALDPLPVDHPVAEAWARLRASCYEKCKSGCRLTTPRSPSRQCR